MSLLGHILKIPVLGGRSGIVPASEFTQEFGGNLLANGDFEIGDPPTGVTAVAVTIDASADANTGLQALRADYSSAGARAYIDTTLGNNTWALWRGWAKSPDATAYNVRPFQADGLTLVKSNSAYEGFEILMRASSASQQIWSQPSSASLFDTYTLQPITLNAQVDAPSANADIVFKYDLPVSPVSGQELQLWFRASDTSLGDLWRVRLIRNAGNTNWDIILNRVTGWSSIAPTSAANIGTTDAVRVEANGDSLKMYTSNDDGDTWTQRGSTISNSTYNSALPVLPLYSSAITPRSLEMVAL